MKSRMGDKIRALRLNNNDTQENLAQKLNVSRQAVSRWENNTSEPNFFTLKQIAKLYQVQKDYFFDEDEINEFSNNKRKNIFQLLDKSWFNLLMVTLSLISSLVIGPLSLFFSVPCFVYSYGQRKWLWVVSYGVAVLLGIYILLTILFPGLVPYSVDFEIKP